MMYNDNGRINKHQQKGFRKLRPAFLNKHGFMVYPSCHNIDIVRRAKIRLRKWLNNDHFVDVSKIV